MGRIFLFTVVLMLLVTSCQKEPITPNTNTIVVPPYNGPIINPQSIVGQTWVITGYRIGTLGNQVQISDTVKFETVNKYTYNNLEYTYSFYPTGSVYNLTMNYTPWGNLSGNVNDNNMNSGLIVGNKFIDVSVGSSNNTEYYLWMKKI